MYQRNDKTTNSIGQTGKTLVRNYFLSHGYTVSDSKSAPEDCVDFIASRKGKTRTIFVRTDTRMAITGNIIIERFMHRGENRIEYGWLFEGKADMLSYLDACNGVLFFLDWEKLKQYAIMNYKAYAFRNQIDENTVGDAYIIPVRALVKSPAFIMKTKIDVSPLMRFSFEKPRPF